ncbi:bacterial surface protein [Winogradskyella psychrotolerans RS-3]|uniref:Bacterial surface protein n=1 Tax=Winogradskyella psychrotolerans RS-3 TaxID=641526 RepID=S7VQN5_9FLAO|nr:Ig-like domain-containing protein [Winogradskyella psychrotolerans]EPR72296.1 bacterial surface protein [Winogradskyella psychrotolerans RS-3]
MIKKYAFWFVSIFILQTSCIGEDVITDFIEPQLRILNPISSLPASETYQFNTAYFNNIGIEEETTVIWSSSDETIATINSTGLLTAISEGVSTISASIQDDDIFLEENFPVTITEDGTVVIIEPVVKSGTIITTSSYLLTGTFTLKEQENSNSLLLSVNSDYQATTSLPGLYLYLTNNPNSISGAYSLGPVSVFNGAHTYTIPETNINDYAYLLYWCQPFGVKVGTGEIVD